MRGIGPGTSAAVLVRTSGSPSGERSHQDAAADDGHRGQRDQDRFAPAELPQGAHLDPREQRSTNRRTLYGLRRGIHEGHSNRGVRRPRGPAPRRACPDPSPAARPALRPRRGGRRQLHRRLPPHGPLPEHAAARPGPWRARASWTRWGRACPASARATAWRGPTCSARTPSSCSCRPSAPWRCPPGLRRDTAAALMLQGMTAHYLCDEHLSRCSRATPASSTRPRAASGCCSCRWPSGAAPACIGHRVDRGEGAPRARGRRRRGDPLQQEDFLEAVRG